MAFPIPIHISFRGVLFASIITCGLGIIVAMNNSQEKLEYHKTSGTITFYSKQFQTLPIRNRGDFRYIKIDTYQYPFEIYEPNSKPTEKTIDTLKVGDVIDIYFYETSNTTIEGLNRFAQFIDKDGQSYFIRSSFQQQLGYVIIGLSLLMDFVAFILWKKRKLKW